MKTTKTHIIFFKRMMKFISKSNQGSIPKVMYIEGFD